MSQSIPAESSFTIKPTSMLFNHNLTTVGKEILLLPQQSWDAVLIHFSLGNSDMQLNIPIGNFAEPSQ